MLICHTAAVLFHLSKYDIGTISTKCRERKDIVCKAEVFMHLAVIFHFVKQKEKEEQKRKSSVFAMNIQSKKINRGSTVNIQYKYSQT